GCSADPAGSSGRDTWTHPTLIACRGVVMKLGRIETGQQVAEYRLKQCRGQGEGGSVWEAENQAGEPRALKFAPCADDAGRLRSIQLVNRLEHQNLLGLEKILTIGKYFVVVTPLADASLQDLFEAYQSEYHTGIEANELCRWLSQAAAALDFLNAT